MLSLLDVLDLNPMSKAFCVFLAPDSIRFPVGGNGILILAKKETASDNIYLHGLGSSVNCLDRRATSCTTRDAKEIAKLLAMLP